MHNQSTGKTVYTLLLLLCEMPFNEAGSRVPITERLAKSVELTAPTVGRSGIVNLNVGHRRCPLRLLIGPTYDMADMTIWHCSRLGFEKVVPMPARIGAVASCSFKPRTLRSNISAVQYVTVPVTVKCSRCTMPSPSRVTEITAPDVKATIRPRPAPVVSR